MADRLPSLHALRVFEAAARHRNFTRAAGELNVTQAAVSQQIALLEADLGTTLFRRVKRRLMLTEAGHALAADVGEALERLRRGVARLKRQEIAGPLTVSTTPSFGARWLVPRLTRFMTAWPVIALRLHTSHEVVDLRRSDVDLAVRHGKGPYPGLHVEPLAEERIFPVCSPKLRSRLRRPGDLRRHVLIQDVGVEWGPWLKAAGVRGIDAARGPSFLDSNLSLQAAIDGQGVALGRTVVAHDDLAAGRLVRPFALSVPMAESYFLVAMPEAAERPRVKAFRDWLFAEMQATLESARSRP
jgi:LysR family glycine cleavage system transcriptional activator